MMIEDQKKYDRQIRLWGREGQRLLGQSHVCILGFSSAGAETLKNLVLPGIGKISIVTPGKVENSHLGTSFFYTTDDIGKNKSDAALANLLELNPDVKGDSHPMQVSEFLNQSSLLGNISLFIVDNLSEDEASKASEKAAELRIPVVHIRASGMVGYVKLEIRQHCVYDGRPDDLNNLRLNDGFKELTEYALTKFNTPEEQFHAPFVVLLLRAIEEWKAAHGGNLPGNSSEKDELKKGLVEKGKALAKELDKDFQKMENFREALKFAFNIYKPRLTDTIQVLFEQEETKSVSQVPDAKAFWVVVRAVQEFYAQTGHLPTNENIPDMETKSEIYLDVKKIYSQAARNDLERVLAIANDVILKGKKPIEAEEAKFLVSSISSASVVTTKPLKETGFNSSSELDVSCSEFGTWKWYLGLIALDRFQKLNEAMPQPENKEKVLGLAEDLRKKLGIEASIEEKDIVEL